VRRKRRGPCASVGRGAPPAWMTFVLHVLQAGWQRGVVNTRGDAQYGCGIAWGLSGRWLYGGKAGQRFHTTNEGKINRKHTTSRGGETAQAFKAADQITPPPSRSAVMSPSVGIHVPGTRRGEGPTTCTAATTASPAHTERSTLANWPV